MGSLSHRSPREDIINWIGHGCCNLLRPFTELDLECDELVVRNRRAVKVETPEGIPSKRVDRQIPETSHPSQRRPHLPHSATPTLTRHPTLQAKKLRAISHFRKLRERNYWQICPARFAKDSSPRSTPPNSASSYFLSTLGVIQVLSRRGWSYGPPSRLTRGCVSL